MRPRGPPPKPTALKLIAGNPGKRRLPTNEPKPPVAAPEPPAHLSDEAQEEWKRLMPLLIELKLMSPLDRAAFAAYCQAWGRHVEAERQIERDGAVAEASNGCLMVHPWVTISKQAVDQMSRFMAEFGLTPSARGRMHIETPPDAGKGAADPKAFEF